jgi:hypothetical protein
MAIERDHIALLLFFLSLDVLLFIIGFGSNKWFSGSDFFYSLWRKCENDIEDDSWDCYYWGEKPDSPGMYRYNDHTMLICWVCLQCRWPHSCPDDPNNLPGLFSGHRRTRSAVALASEIRLEIGALEYHPPRVCRSPLSLTLLGSYLIISVAVLCALLGLVAFAMEVTGPTPNEWGYWLCVIGATTSGCLCLIEIEMFFVEYRSPEEQTPQMPPTTMPHVPTTGTANSSLNRRASTSSMSRRPVSSHYNPGGWVDVSMQYPVTMRSSTNGAPQTHNSIRPMTYPYQQRDWEEI